MLRQVSSIFPKLEDPVDGSSTYSSALFNVGNACPMNMHRNNELLLLWQDVAVVAGHVVVRYEEKMYLFKVLQACPTRHNGGAVGRLLYLIRLFVQIRVHKVKIRCGL